MTKVTIDMDPETYNRFRRYLEKKYKGKWWGMQGKEISWAVEEYITAQDVMNRAGYTHTQPGEGGKNGRRAKKSRTDREAEKLYAELESLGMLGDPEKNAPAILQYIARTRGRHPDTLRKYFFLIISLRERDEGLPPVPTRDWEEVYKRTYRTIMEMRGYL